MNSDREEALKLQEENPSAMTEADNAKLVITELPQVALRDFIRVERKFYLCLDTLGQDRVFEDSEQMFIVNAVKEIVKAREDLESKYLLENRDTKMIMNELETKYKESVSLLFFEFKKNPQETYNDEEDKFVKEYLATFNENETKR